MSKELTEEQKVEGARDYWSMAVEAALYANLYFQDDLSQTAWDEKDVVTGAGRLVAVFDQDEYEWLEAQYGKGICLNKEFVSPPTKSRLFSNTFIYLRNLLMLSTRTYDEFIAQVQALCMKDFSDKDEKRIATLGNLAAKRAYKESQWWERWLVASEPRTATRGRVDASEDSFYVFGAGTAEVNGLYVRFYQRQTPSCTMSPIAPQPLR